MGNSQRLKGSRGETEAMGLLQGVVDKVCEEKGVVRYELKKNRDQRYSAKEYDIFGLPWFAVEIKRQENMSGYLSWWRQVLAATKEGQIPILMYRPNNTPWRVTFRALLLAGRGEEETRVRATVDVDIGTFLYWLEHFLLNVMK